jgi:hypothetical protein
VDGARQHDVAVVADAGVRRTQSRVSAAAVLTAVSPDQDWSNWPFLKMPMASDSSSLGVGPRARTATTVMQAARMVGSESRFRGVSMDGFLGAVHTS